MNPDVITVRADVTIDVVLRYLRLRGEMPDNTDHLYVVSRRHQYLGRIPLTALLLSEPSRPINQLMDEDDHPAIPVDTFTAEVARMFEDHDWVSAPVVDENNILLGRITIDDVVDIIREQAEHQVLSAAGLNEDEDMFSPVLRAAPRRMIWLGINLLTAFLAASVVGRFEETIEKVVALAVLMPIVAGMGGNAGTQVLALMIRGLALGQVGASNVRTLIWKELRVALLNGLGLGLILAGAVWLWFGDPKLSGVIFAALVINLMAASLAGVAVPLTLKRLGFDPALASSIFLTTVTDVFGFFAFLGLGTLLLL
jgi:magnesium transporter